MLLLRSTICYYYEIPRGVCMGPGFHVLIVALPSTCYYVPQTHPCSIPITPCIGATRRGGEGGGRGRWRLVFDCRSREGRDYQSQRMQRVHHRDHETLLSCSPFLRDCIAKARSRYTGSLVRDIDTYVCLWSVYNAALVGAPYSVL